MSATANWVLRRADRLASHLPTSVKPALWTVRDLALGWWPRPVADWRSRRVTKNPVAFTEKIRYRIAYDRRPILTTFADKVGMRDYVTERVGADYLTQCYGVYGDAASIEWERFPREYVLKASHGSGGIIVVSDSAPEEARLPTTMRRLGWGRYLVRPEHARPAVMEQLAARWLTMNYEYALHRLPEWCYRDIPPRILVEELLLGAEGHLPEDWKCFVFDGETRMVAIEIDRYGDHREELVRRDGSRIPVRWAFDAPDSPTELPANFDELVEIADALGRGIDFVRVDLYNIDGRIIVGELTNYPFGGQASFSDERWDGEIGSYWNLAT
jgi:hypothetical protein